MATAIVQARTGSTRFPKKVLADIQGKPMVVRVLERVGSAAMVERVVLATTTNSEDSLLAGLASEAHATAFRGSTNDVLDRYYQAADSVSAETIVRVTADCPVIDPALIDECIELFRPKDCDYVSTAYPTPTFPDGLDVEIFSREALERAWREAKLTSEREHVTPYIWKNPELFRTKTIEHRPDLSDLRLTVDEPKDLDFVREIYRRLAPKETFGLEEILALLEQSPELHDINRGIERNAGYERSLREDRRERP